MTGCGPDISAILRTLPPGWRDVLILREIHGLSYDAIGRRLGISREAVCERLCAARRATLERLEPT